jgi:GAF domain-containing protein
MDDGAPGTSTPTGDATLPDALAGQLSELARALQQERAVQPTLDAIVLAAVETVPGADHASITAVRNRKEVATVASTSDVARAVDRAQYEAGQGPCLDVLYERATARLDDLTNDRRWPRFTRRAAGLGIRSMLGLRQFVQDDDLGALNLFGEAAGAFDEESQHVALLFASHAAVAMAGAQAQDQLRTAMGTRTVISQAQGILMERFSLDDDGAFRLLVRVSQHANRKLRDVAVDLVEGGRLPSG